MNATPRETGTLYVVATPVGNLADMTFRAVDILKSVSLIAAEDTRHTQKILSRYQIDNRMISCHEHNEIRKKDVIIEHLESGRNVALVSDAGTPCISDPGYLLVKKAAEQNIPVIPVPGCSAVTAGLSICGLATDQFLFIGFLPRKKNRRAAILTSLENTSATLIFYESPRRIISLCQDILEILGNRTACLAREMTKLHEEYIRGPVDMIIQQLESRQAIKGECALFVQGGHDSPEGLDDDTLAGIIRTKLAQEKWRTADLARHIALEHSISKKKAYDMILSIGQKP